MRARLLAVIALLSIAVPLSASIRGTVMNRSGQAIAGAKVSIFPLETSAARQARILSATPSRTALATATTNNNGAFVLDSPKEPVVDVQFEAAGYAPAALRVLNNEDAVVGALVSAIPKQGTITTAGGKPVAGANVIWTDGAAELTLVSDAAGHYTVPDPTWATLVEVVHPDFAPLQKPTISPIQRATVNLTLDPGVPLNGHLLKGTSPVGKTVILIDGLPLATTADDGTFAVAHAPRNWELAEASAGDSKAVQARAKSPLTLKLAAASTLSGVVLDGKNHQPLAGAGVKLFPPMSRRMMRTLSASSEVDASAITDAKGNFSVTLKPGSYEVATIHPAYSSATATILAAAGQKLTKTISASQLGQISGTVVDDENRPVAAANVTAAQSSRRGGGGGAAYFINRGGGDSNIFSGTDGRFTVRTSMQGELEVNALKKGLPRGSSSAFKLASGERKSGITVTISRGVALTGRVLGPDGKPLSGVAVTASEAERAGSPRGGAMVRRMVASMAAMRDSDPVMTASDGTFSLRVKPASYDLHFSREGFAPKLVKADDVSASTKPIVVTLEAGVEISGRVVRGGTGLEGVMVATFSADGRAMATTASDGSFVLADLVPGSYMVTAFKSDDFVQQMRTVSAPAKGVVIEVPAGGRITGHVVDKSNHEPVTAFEAGIGFSRNAGGFAIAGPPMMKNFTSDDGSFTLENVPAGPAQLIVSAPGYVAAHQSNISVEEGKTVADVQVELDTGVRLTGRVTGPDGAPVNGVTVRPAGGGGMRIPGMPGETVTMTDASGEYTLDSLESGDSKTFAFGAPGLLPSEKTVNLAGREVRLDVQLSGGLTISGQVVTDAGAPVPDAEVSAFSAAVGATGKQGQTDASGAFTFDAMAPGRYTFRASKEGFAQGQLPDFSVAAGTSPRIVLKSGGILTGHVSGVADADLSKVTVTARSSNGATGATLDSGGNYRIEGAPVGTLRVSAMLQRGFTDVQTTDVKSIELEAGGSAHLDLQFTANTVIRGRVTRNGAAAANSTVQFFPKDGTVQTRAGSPTDQNGNYTVSGLSDGEYNVSVVDIQRINSYSTTYSVHGSGTFDITMTTYTIRGHVVDRGDSSPIGGARVQLRQTGTAQMPFMGSGAVSDDSGGFLIDGVAPGAYALSADKDGYGNVVKDLTVSDSTPAEVMLDLARNDGITLRVVDGRDGTTLNPYVTLYDAQNRVAYNTARFGFGAGTDSDRIPVAAGQYRAVIGASGYAPKTVSLMSPSTQTVSLTPGGSIMLHSKSAAPLRVTLLDANGAPYLRPYAPDPSIVVPVGDTRLPNVAPGPYTLQITGVDGSGGSSQTVVVVEGQEALVNLG